MSTANRLSTLANGLRVLEHLAGRSMSMRELATACGLPRQTTYRIVATLIDQGWVDRTGATYRVSTRLRSLIDLQDDLSGAATAPRAAPPRAHPEPASSTP